LGPTSVKAASKMLTKSTPDDDDVLNVGRWASGRQKDEKLNALLKKTSLIAESRVVRMYFILLLLLIISTVIFKKFGTQFFRKKTLLYILLAA